jgi:hypothetical protein
LFKYNPVFIPPYRILGSLDDLTTWDFHARCDGRTKTLMLVENTDGNVFGDFAPVE